MFHQRAILCLIIWFENLLMIEGKGSCKTVRILFFIELVLVVLPNLSLQLQISCDVMKINWCVHNKHFARISNKSSVCEWEAPSGKLSTFT